MIRCCAKNRSSITPRCGQFLAIFAVLQRIARFWKRFKNLQQVQYVCKFVRKTCVANRRCKLTSVTPPLYTVTLCAWTIGPCLSYPRQVSALWHYIVTLLLPAATNRRLLNCSRWFRCGAHLKSTILFCYKQIASGRRTETCMGPLRAGVCKRFATRITRCRRPTKLMNIAIIKENKFSASWNYSTTELACWVNYSHERRIYRCWKEANYILACASFPDDASRLSLWFSGYGSVRMP